MKTRLTTLLLAFLLIPAARAYDPSDTATIDRSTAAIKQLTELIGKTAEPSRTQYFRQAIQEMETLLAASARKVNNAEYLATYNREKLASETAEAEAFKKERDSILKKATNLADISRQGVTMLRDLAAKNDALLKEKATNERRMEAVKQVEADAASWKALYEAEKLKNAQAYLDGKASAEKK